jgi:hypothetical protein
LIIPVIQRHHSGRISASDSGLSSATLYSYFLAEKGEIKEFST